MQSVVVSEENGGVRLDKFVTDFLNEPSRSYVATLIHSKKILVNKEPKQSSYKLKVYDKVTIDYDAVSSPEPYNLDIPILYEDDNVIVLDKPTGFLTHSKGAFNPEATVASFIKNKVTDIDDKRAGIVHRLDRATSGVIVCAKNEKTLLYLQKQFADRKVQKIYIAVVNGRLKTENAIIDMPIDRNPKDPKKFRVASKGKPAVTEYKVLEYDDQSNRSLLELKPKTGRTHQLRVHLNYIKHPIIGDDFYDGAPFERLMLHAHKLKIELASGQPKEFVASIPDIFNNCLHNE